MTITFKDDNDVIIYALEKIISYARDNRYIFLAQSIWWISSIIGLQQGLVNYIDTLRVRSEELPQDIKESPENREALSQNKNKISRTNTGQYDREISATPRDIQEDSRSRIELDYIHPDRLSQIQRTNDDIRDLDLSRSESSLRPRIIERTKRFIQKSRKDKKALKKKIDKVSRTRTGKQYLHT